MFFWFLLPKPPPMYLEMTRTWWSSRPRSRAVSWRQLEIPCEGVYSVSFSPSQLANEQRGSIWALWINPVSYLSSNIWSDSLNPASTSPTSEIIGSIFPPKSGHKLPSGQIWGAPSSRASSGSSTNGNSSYSTSIRDKASSAMWRSVAATAATESPTKRTGLLKI